MSGYGKVISGGDAMRKGVSKGINNKLSARESEISRRETTAKAVKDAYKVNTLSEQHVQKINGGSFTKGVRPSRV